jgi:Amt family ammonium transporter
MFIKYVLRVKLRIPDDQLEIGDLAVHGEEAYPNEDLVSVSSSLATEASPRPSLDAKTPEAVTAKDD